MKKLFVLIMALLLLCSCGVEEEPVIEKPQSEEEVSFEPETEIKKYDTDNSCSKETPDILPSYN